MGVLTRFQELRGGTIQLPYATRWRWQPDHKKLLANDVSVSLCTVKQLGDSNSNQLLTCCCTRSFLHTDIIQSYAFVTRVLCTIKLSRERHLQHRLTDKTKLSKFPRRRSSRISATPLRPPTDLHSQRRLLDQKCRLLGTTVFCGPPRILSRAAEFVVLPQKLATFSKYSSKQMYLFGSWVSAVSRLTSN